MGASTRRRAAAAAAWCAVALLEQAATVFPAAPDVAIQSISASLAPAPQDGWLRLSTPNFDIVGPTSEANLRQVGARLERFRQALGRLLPHANLAAARPARIVVFPTHAAYEPFKPLYEGKAKSLVEGHALSAAGRTYMMLTTEGGDLGVIYHEYVHVLVHTMLAGAPMWFDEGLAEFYSTFEVTPRGVAQVGTAPRSHLLLLRRQALLPLTTLLAADHESPLYNESDKASAFYAQSWALVHYLLLGHEGRHAARLAAFVARLGEGEPLDRACEEELGTTPDLLERDLADYVAHDTFARQSIELGDAPAGLDVTPVVPVTPADAHATLGDVLFLMGRVADAEGQLRAALSRDPSYVPAHSVLGQLLAETDRPGEAQSHLERAIASPAATWLTHLTYATVLMTERPPGATSPADAAIERSLRRAIALNPSAAEPYGQLAWLKAQSPRTMREAGSLADDALARAPGDEAIQLLRAQVLVNTRRYADARPLVARLTRANDASVRRQALDILDKLDALASATAGRTAADVGLVAVSAADTSGGIVIFRTLGPGEQRAAGWLASVDCTVDGVVFAGRTKSGAFRLRARRLEDVQLLTYSTRRRGLACGERLGTAVVVVTYTGGRVGSTGLTGRAVAIEFPPVGYTPRERGGQR